jgi:hypothetical protein
MQFGQQAPGYTLFPGKNAFLSKEDQNFEFLMKREFGLILR